MSRFHELRVNAIDRETSDAVSVGFEVPDRLKEDFTFVAGQYLTLEKEIAGKAFRRSYSICTSPESGQLKVTVKEIADGRFSAWVNKRLKIGDKLNVFLPEGRFTFYPRSSNRSKAYIAFSAGSGITPVMAILQSVLRSEPNSTFVLVYGNKTPEHTIFYKDLLALKEAYPNRFFIEFAYSQLKEEKSPLKFLKRKLFKRNGEEEKEINRPIYGRIKPETADFILKDKYKDVDFEEFYLCGPGAMITAISTSLHKHGISDENIHFELFVTEEEQKEVENLGTGKTQVTVILDDEEVTFEMNRRERVLDAIMDEGMDPPYSCQGGICSSCMAQVEEGETTMANNQILTDSEVKSGLVLTCQAHPTTPTLRVNYDDI